MVTVPTGGAGLEARVQRLFMAQGVFAERGLFPSASPDHHMLATDIDVLVSEYVSGFHITRRHAECKGGRIPLLDRILWLRGVRRLLGADGSYLVVPDFDTDASEFARSLDIQLLTLKQLEGWEAAIPILQDLWPCRSDYQTYDNAKTVWMKLSGSKEADADWRFLREILGFIQIDSWLSFYYRHLNKLLRLIADIARQYEKTHSDRNRELCSRYCFSALLVRLCQYLLAICYDVSRLPITDVGTYLYQRLTYGDQDPERTSGLINGTVLWIKQGLEKKGIPIPPEIDVGRLYEPPQYATDLLELINRLLQQSHEARYLPIAMETMQFGIPEVVGKFPRLKAAASAGDSLAALVKGFVIRAFSIPKSLTKPMSSELRIAYHTATDQTKKHGKDNQAPLPFQA
jgi:hypothetical protein